MTTYYKTQGFVFKKGDSLEADRVFSVFTKDFGRMEILGRGIRKIDSKLRGGIEVFSLSYIEFVQGRIRKTLTDAVFIEKFKNIYRNTNMLETAHKISQLADNFIKGEEPDEKIWNLLVDAFEKLNQNQLQVTHCQLVYNYFFWNFVSILGYSPELSNCANCQKKLNPYELYFSNKEGGVICKSCYALNRDGLKIKSDIVKKDWDILSKLKLENSMQESLKELSDTYYSYLSTNVTSNFKDV